MNYFEVDFKIKDLIPNREILTYRLGEVDFESFTEEDYGLKAYIQESLYNKEAIEEIVSELNALTSISFTSNLIQDENWNKTWEENFDPIYVEDKCVIRAPFHSIEKDFDYDIIIEPQMSFGTGHHETTYLIVKSLLELELSNKRLLDMGCGTGVLAILAEKLGAKSIQAIDIDEWAYNNTLQNIELNNSKEITPFLGGAKLISKDPFDVIIANINKNILIKDMECYAKSLKLNGYLLLSGFFTTDVNDLTKVANSLGMEVVSQIEKNTWAVLKLIKTS